MTISVWRYSHLALAVSSFAFITLAAVTGILLACEPVNEKMPSYRTSDFNQISVAQTVPVLKKTFTEVTEVSIDVNQFMTVKGIDTAGKSVLVYVDPKNGNVLGTAGKKNEFFQWITALHRSLFLHELGRFFIGLTSFLLMLITVSGAILVIQRQRGLKRFFTRVVKENFAQYYHVVLGRLSLIPIFIIALTGTYLSLVRFNVFPEKKIVHKINFDKVQGAKKKALADFTLFKEIPLRDVRSIEYPFSDDPEDYYLLKLKDREIAVDQFSGEKLSELPYPMTTILTTLSLDVHTGRKSILWSIVLAVASVNILFFIYSGFAITLKRISNRAKKNKYKASDCRVIILVGSENGSTLRFANAMHQQLISNGQTSFLTELNSYRVYPKAEHIIVLTATYGLGNPPSNADRFQSLVEKYPQQQTVHFSVLGFGSHAYPDFCRFAFEAHNILSAQSWALPLLDIHTVNDKSPDQFSQWFNTWSQKADLPEIELPEGFHGKPSGLQMMKVTGKTVAIDDAFIVRLQPKRWTRFTSGNLLAIYPADDHRERLYSIGKINKEIQLSVKHIKGGLGSGYLYDLTVGSTIQARINGNENFQFPYKAPTVVMISNGTGIAPYLGMIDQNHKKTDCHLYCGFRTRSSFALYQEELTGNLTAKKLRQLQVAYSREGEKQYVMNLLARDVKFIADVLANKGVIMLCGSLSMEKDVIALLAGICKERMGKEISYYQSCGQILSDCY